MCIDFSNIVATFGTVAESLNAAPTGSCSKRCKLFHDTEMIPSVGPFLTHKNLSFELMLC